MPAAAPADKKADAKKRPPRFINPSATPYLCTGPRGQAVHIEPISTLGGPGVHILTGDFWRIYHKGFGHGLITVDEYRRQYGKNGVEIPDPDDDEPTTQVETDKPSTDYTPPVVRSEEDLKDDGDEAPPTPETAPARRRGK